MKGNCIDTFISKKIENMLDNIKLSIFDIENRKYVRSTHCNYFSTGCYEKDFSNIIDIRNNAKLLLENCNKFLERISDQYSKLN